jgi:protein-L-isoaspartate(D-aspartate) O-methyltransferase
MREFAYEDAPLPIAEEYIWFDESGAVTPLDTKELEGLPDTYPFGL